MSLRQKPLNRRNDDLFHAELGLRIGVARSTKRMTQQRLAAKVRLSRASIANIERGKHGAVSLRTVDRIARALKIPLSRLLPRLTDD